MSKLDLSPLFERMADTEQPPEPAALREERRKRVVGDMRRLHVRLVHERARGASARRLSRVILIAATLAVAGAAFASVEGYGPFARRHSAPGTSEAALVCAPPECARTNVPAAPAAPLTSEPALPALDTPSTAPGLPARAAAPEARATGTSVRRDEKSTLEAINRLFTEAKRARREGRNGDALVALDQLLGKYPHSVLAQEASVERFRVLSKLGRSAEARRAAAAYLSRYPSGFAASEAERLSGNPDAP